MEKTMAIKTNNISKSFDRFQALCDISVSVPRGEVFGLIGRNGAGKTTLMRIICGLMKPGSGTYEAGQTSFLPQNVRFRDNMTAGEVLKFFAGLKGCSTEDALKFACELEVDLKKKAASLSPGQQRKLQLAVTAIGTPEILVLDEPTAGLDPPGVKQVRNIIGMLRRRGSTVLISTHVLNELENLCGAIAVIDKGRLLFQGQFRNAYEIEAEGMDSKTVSFLRDTMKCRFELDGGVLTAEVEKSEVPQVLNILHKLDIKIFGVGLRSIETLYSRLLKEAG